MTHVAKPTPTILPAVTAHVPTVVPPAHVPTILPPVVDAPPASNDNAGGETFVYCY